MKLQVKKLTRSAFTLVELLVVLAIIAIIISLLSAAVIVACTFASKAMSRPARR